MTRPSRRPARPPADPSQEPSAGSPGSPTGRGDAPSIEGSLAGYRILRRIASGDRADLYLAVAERGTEAAAEAEAEQPDASAAARPLVVLRIYGATAGEQSIATEIEVMGTDASRSTPALLDVAAFDDGRACLVVERLAGPGLTQLLGDRSLSAGEAVTVLAPIVQAVGQLERRGFVHTRLSVADILLDERGRPRLVGLGAVRRLADAATAPDRIALMREGEAALLRLVADVAAATEPAGAFAGCVELLEASLASRPFVTCTDELERALFRVSAPAPIAGVQVRHRSPALPARMAADPMGVPAPPSTSVAVGARVGSFARLASIAQFPDALATELAGAVDGASTRALRERLRAFLAPRRRALVFAGAIGAAALVALLTVVPPAGGASRAAGGGTAHATDSPAASAGAAAAEPAPEPAAITAEVEPTAAAAELLEVRESCLSARDVDCIGAVTQPGSPLEAADRSALLDPEGDGAAALGEFDLDSVALVADMGSAVLLEVSYVDAGREPASLLMMRSEAGWRLRELFD